MFTKSSHLFSLKLTVQSQLKKSETGETIAPRAVLYTSLRDFKKLPHQLSVNDIFTIIFFYFSLFFFVFSDVAGIITFVGDLISVTSKKDANIRIPKRYITITNERYDRYFIVYILQYFTYMSPRVLTMNETFGELNAVLQSRTDNAKLTCHRRNSTHVIAIKNIVKQDKCKKNYMWQ